MDFMLCESIENLEQVDLNKVIGELKKDGERLLLIKESDRLELWNRRGKEKSFCYPELLEVSKVSHNFILDGEVCSINEKFNDLQKRALLTDRYKIEIRKKEIPVIFYVFDILSFDNKDLTNLPLIERKKYLEHFRNLNNLVVLNWFEGEEIKELWNYVKENEKEGIILKFKNSAYIFSRSNSWLKLKNFKETIIEFSMYEMNNSGIKLTSENALYEIQVQNDNSDRVGKIKEKIDKGEKVKCEVQYLEKTKNNKLRFPSCKEVLI